MMALARVGFIDRPPCVSRDRPRWQDTTNPAMLDLRGISHPGLVRQVNRKVPVQIVRGNNR